MPRDYFSEEIERTASRPNVVKDYYAEEIEAKPKKSFGRKLIDTAAEGFKVGVLEDPIFQQKSRAAAEVASAAFPLFQPTTNVAVKMQEGEFRPRRLARSFVRGLPVPRIDPELGPTVTPREAERPGKIITNVAKAIKPDFQEPQDPISLALLDMAGGVFTGAPTAALERGASVLGKAGARADAFRAARTLKNLPERQARLMGSQVEQTIARQPRQLPAPRNLGEGFEIITPEEANFRTERRLAPTLAAFSQRPKALPAPRRLGRDFLIISPEESAATIQKQRQPILEAIEKQPKLLEARYIGETFQRTTPGQAKAKILTPIQKDISKIDKELNRLIEAEAVTLEEVAGNLRGGEIIRPEEGGRGFRTSLPSFIKRAETGRKPANRREFLELARHNLGRGQSATGVIDEFEELSAAKDYLLGKVKQSPLSERGFARIGKNFEGMGEEELKKEILRLKGEGQKKQRRFIQTVREAEKTKPEVSQSIQGEYAPITNQETLNRAKQIIQINLDDAVKIAKSDAPATAESNTVAQLLIDKFQNEGRFQDAIDIVEKTAQKATTQGQAIQALSMYSRLSPEGILRYTQRVIDRANQANPGSGIKLNPDLAEELISHAKRLKDLPEGRNKILETAKLLRKAHETIPPSLLKKISTFQTLAQLLNPKTAVRNLVGNMGFAAVENVSDVVGTGIDKAVSAFTGQRTKTLPSLKAQGHGFLKGGREAVEEIKQGVNIAPQGTQFDIPKTAVFKGRVGQSLENLLNYELRVPDRAFYQAAYDGSLNNQMRAAKVSAPTQHMKEIAHLDALYRTFQDENAASYVFQKVKKALNVGKEFGLGDLVIKYPKTPGALLARGIEYSPVGFIKSAMELYRGLKGMPFNQKAFVESTSRATVGSGLVGSGILLSKLGIITGRKEESKGIRALKQETGLRDYQVNASALFRFIASGFDPEAAKRETGDLLATYDWFQPQAIDLAIGANIEENKGKASGVVGTIADSIASGTTTLAEQPLVQGVRRLFGYGDVVQGVGDILKGVPASFVPTLLNQVKLLMDDVARNPEAESPVQESVNLVKMKLPGASKTLPPRLTPFGEERKYRAGEGGQRAFNTFLNPAITARYGESPDTKLAEELIRLDIAIPEQGNTYRKIPLNQADKFSINKIGGQTVKDVLAQLINDPRYQQLDDNKKAEAIEKVIRKSRESAQKKRILEMSNERN